MSLPPVLQKLRIPVIGAPMFIATPEASVPEKKVWRDIWSAGQGVGQIDAVIPVAQLVDKLENEYAAARRRLQMN